MKTEYTRVSELVELFDQYWVPFETTVVGYGSSGAEIKSIIDMKANRLYLEQYNTTLDSYEVFSFESGKHPTTWQLEADIDKRVSI